MYKDIYFLISDWYMHHDVFPWKRFQDYCPFLRWIRQSQLDAELWCFICCYDPNNVLNKQTSCWWFMMTSSNGNIFRVTGPLCGEFTGPGEFPAQRPVTPNFDAFFDLRPNKRLSTLSWGWWFETPSWSLWRQCNVEISWLYVTLF